jgi:hypothetical protein
MLVLTESPCRIGKIGNDLEHHGDDQVTAFNVPVTTELTAADLNSLLEDRYFSRRLFDEGNGRGRPTSPGDGFQRIKPLELRDSFEDVRVELTMRGKTVLTFEACKVSKITLEPCLGGTTECNFSIHLRPKTDKEILQLLHHQHREVEVTLSGGKVIASKRQQELPLEAKDGDKAEDQPGDDNAPEHPYGSPNGNVTPFTPPIR